jgi:hypothetical protein
MSGVNQRVSRIMRTANMPTVARLAAKFQEIDVTVRRARLMLRSSKAMVEV